MNPKPIHAFAAPGEPGRAPCGAWLARGWLDVTEDLDKITCANCLAMLPWKIVDADDPGVVFVEGSEQEIRNAFQVLVSILAGGGRFALLGHSGHVRMVVSTTPVVVRGSDPEQIE